MHARTSQLVLVLLGFTAIGCAPIPSPKFKSLQKTARFWGIGWSEGYHQCPENHHGECEKSKGLFGKFERKKEGCGSCKRSDCNGICGGSCGSLVSGPSILGNKGSFLGHSNVAGYQLDASGNGFQLVNIPPLSRCGCCGTGRCGSCGIGGIGYTAVPYDSSCGSCGVQSGFSTPGCIGCAHGSTGIHGSPHNTLDLHHSQGTDLLGGDFPAGSMQQPERLPKIVTPTPTPAPARAPVPDPSSDHFMESDKSMIDLEPSNDNDSLLDGDSFTPDQVDDLEMDELDSLLPSPSDVDATSIDGMLLPRRPELPPAPAVNPLSLQPRPGVQLRGQPIRKPGLKSAAYPSTSGGLRGYTASGSLLNRYSR